MLMRSRRCGVNKSASQLSLPHISEDLIKSDTFPPTRLPYVTPPAPPPPLPPPPPPLRPKKKQKNTTRSFSERSSETVAAPLPPEGLSRVRGRRRQSPLLESGLADDTLRDVSEGGADSSKDGRTFCCSAVGAKKYFSG